ncbi:MAG: polyprenyl synthetase family protein [Clostridiales bacterium]|jgi:geranylgeranyl diphosphate synthase type II|nr:polyprenyl synthetase family protein [Clostridiales bacterium]
MSYKKYYDRSISRINSALESLFSDGDFKQKTLIDAMRYSLLSGGKRIRPILFIEFCKASGGDPDTALIFALAVEMIHTYSLIHDDLPCMDNDDLRRGLPTNHIVFGEATAVLAGDALLNAAFELMLSDKNELFPGTASMLPKKLPSAETRLEVSRIIAQSSGAFGMIGGQILDMENENREVDVSLIEDTQRLKTGALISAACVGGCVLAETSLDKRHAAAKYADAIGLAFQIKDDMLNVTGDEDTLGKPVGSDTDRGKKTFVDFYGISECERLVEKLTLSAKEQLSYFKNNEFLIWLTDYLASRNS